MLSDFEPSPGDLEDVTELIFKSTEHLTGMQMLCKPTLDLFDTMNSFEVMHDKMDSRMHRAAALTVKAAKEQGIIAAELTDQHRHALVSELLVHFATWQDQNALLLQTLYSCIYLTDRKLY
jgi:hypothetical protein